MYLWAFSPVPLNYISVFVPVPHCFGDCTFVVYSEALEPDSSSSIFLSQDFFGYSWSLCLHTNFEIFFSSSVKRTIGNSIAFDQ